MPVDYNRKIKSEEGNTTIRLSSRKVISEFQEVLNCNDSLGYFYFEYKRIPNLVTGDVTEDEYEVQSPTEQLWELSFIDSVGNTQTLLYKNYNIMIDKLIEIHGADRITAEIDRVLRGESQQVEPTTQPRQRQRRNIPIIDYMWKDYNTFKSVILGLLNGSIPPIKEAEQGNSGGIQLPHSETAGGQVYDALFSLTQYLGDRTPRFCDTVVASNINQVKSLASYIKSSRILSNINEFKFWFNIIFGNKTVKDSNGFSLRFMDMFMFSGVTYKEYSDLYNQLDSGTTKNTAGMLQISSHNRYWANPSETDVYKRRNPQQMTISGIDMNISASLLYSLGEAAKSPDKTKFFNIMATTEGTLNIDGALGIMMLGYRISNYKFSERREGRVYTGDVYDALSGITSPKDRAFYNLMSMFLDVYNVIISLLYIKSGDDADGNPSILSELQKEYGEVIKTRLKEARKTLEDLNYFDLHKFVSTVGLETFLESYASANSIDGSFLSESLENIITNITQDNAIRSVLDIIRSLPTDNTINLDDFYDNIKSKLTQKGIGGFSMANIPQIDGIRMEEILDFINAYPKAVEAHDWLPKLFTSLTLQGVLPALQMLGGYSFFRNNAIIIAIKDVMDELDSKIDKTEVTKSEYTDIVVKYPSQDIESAFLISLGVDESDTRNFIKQVWPGIFSGMGGSQEMFANSELVNLPIRTDNVDDWRYISKTFLSILNETNEDVIPSTIPSNWLPVAYHIYPDLKKQGEPDIKALRRVSQVKLSRETVARLFDLINGDITSGIIKDEDYISLKIDLLSKEGNGITQERFFKVFPDLKPYISRRYKSLPDVLSYRDVNGLIFALSRDMSDASFKPTVPSVKKTNKVKIPSTDIIEAIKSDMNISVKSKDAMVEYFNTKPYWSVSDIDKMLVVFLGTSSFRSMASHKGVQDFIPYKVKVLKENDVLFWHHRLGEQQFAVLLGVKDNMEPDLVKYANERSKVHICGGSSQERDPDGRIPGFNAIPISWCHLEYARLGDTPNEKSKNKRDVWFIRENQSDLYNMGGMASNVPKLMKQHIRDFEYNVVKQYFGDYSLIPTQLEYKKNTPKYDEFGKPVYKQKLDDVGLPLTDSKGNPVYKEQLDADGKVMYNDSGNIMYEPELENAWRLVSLTDGPPKFNERGEMYDIDGNTVAGDGILRDSSGHVIDIGQGNRISPGGYLIDDNNNLVKDDRGNPIKKFHYISQLPKGSIVKHTFDNIDDSGKPKDIVNAAGIVPDPTECVYMMNQSGKLQPTPYGSNAEVSGGKIVPKPIGSRIDKKDLMQVFSTIRNMHASSNKGVPYNEDLTFKHCCTCGLDRDTLSSYLILYANKYSRLKQIVEDIKRVKNSGSINTDTLNSLYKDFVDVYNTELDDTIKTALSKNLNLKPRLDPIPEGYVISKAIRKIPTGKGAPEDVEYWGLFPDNVEPTFGQRSRDRLDTLKQQVAEAKARGETLDIPGAKYDNKGNLVSVPDIPSNAVLVLGPVNIPVMEDTGELNKQGKPVRRPKYGIEYEIGPDGNKIPKMAPKLNKKGKEVTDENGNVIMEPVRRIVTEPAPIPTLEDHTVLELFNKDNAVDFGFIDKQLHYGISNLKNVNIDNVDTMFKDNKILDNFARYTQMSGWSKQFMFVPVMMFIEVLRRANAAGIEEIWMPDGNIAYAKAWSRDDAVYDGETVMRYYNGLALSFGGKLKNTTGYQLEGSPFFHAGNEVAQHYVVNVKEALAMIGSPDTKRIFSSPNEFAVDAVNVVYTPDDIKKKVKIVTDDGVYIEDNDNMFKLSWATYTPVLDEYGKQVIETVTEIDKYGKKYTTQRKKVMPSEETFSTMGHIAYAVGLRTDPRGYPEIKKYVHNIVSKDNVVDIDVVTHPTKPMHVFLVDWKGGTRQKGLPNTERFIRYKDLSKGLSIRLGEDYLKRMPELKRYISAVRHGHRRKPMDNIKQYDKLLKSIYGVTLSRTSLSSLAKSLDRVITAQLNNKVGQMTSEGQMERDVPGEITPLDNEGTAVIDPNAVPNTTGTQPVSEREAVDRATKLQKDIDSLRTAFTEVLHSSYSMTLSEKEMDELMRKIISTIASYVTDVTVDRVEEITGLEKD